MAEVNESLKEKPEWKDWTSNWPYKQHLYWDFDPEYKEKLQQKEKPDSNIEDNIYYPYIKRLSDNFSKSNSWLITLQADELIITRIKKWKTNINSLIKWLWSNDKKNIILVLSQINLDDNKEWKINEDFFNDHPDIQKKIDKKESNIPSSFFERDLYSMIWQNYIKINSWNEKIDKEKNYKTTIEVSANRILKKYTNIPIDTVAYSNAMKDIKSGNKHKMFFWLKWLYLLASTSAWSKWKKSDKLKRNITKWEIDYKEKIKERIDTLKNRAKLEIDKNQRQNIEKEILELETIKEKLNEVKIWEIFKAEDPIETISSEND
jgi:hypothetical protein